MLIPRRILFGNPEKDSPQISPDGRRIAYLAPDEGVLNVWVRTIGAADDRPITSDRRRGIRAFLWQDSSAHLLYVQDRDGDENWHVHQVDLASRAARDLTPYENIQAQPLAREESHPDVLLVALNIRDPRLHDVYRLDLRTGELAVDTSNPGDVAGWAADAQLRVRASTSMTPDGGTVVRVRRSLDADWQDFQHWGPEETFGGIVGFTLDGRAIRLLSSVDANAARLVEADLATGRLDVLAQDPQYDVGNVLVDRRTKRVEAVQFVRARSEWEILDESVRRDFDAIRSVGDADFNVVSRDLANRSWIVGYTEDDAPVHYYAYDRRSREATRLFANRPALDGYRLSPMQPIAFAARDGLTIHGYLTLPIEPAPGRPMVLLVHGGPWARDVWGLNNEVQWLANRGYAVLQVNFRGSIGYGKAFVNAGNREWAGRMHDDLVDAKRWAVARGYASDDRVAIYGGSYGGYATLVGLTFTPDEFACGVDIVGPSSLVTLISSIPPYWSTVRGIFDRRVGHLETEQEFLDSRSPLFRADRIRKPLLIAQGANDPRVKQAESDQIVQAMRAKGLPVEYLVFPDEGHGFARPENRFRFYAAAERFLAKHLGGRAEPPGEGESTEGLER
jgi:dipeptidyl aminopeptidase/acylaminoacyl peptidase